MKGLTDGSIRQNRPIFGEVIEREYDDGWSAVEAEILVVMTTQRGTNTAINRTKFEKFKKSRLRRCH